MNKDIGKTVDVIRNSPAPDAGTIYKILVAEAVNRPGDILIPVALLISCAEGPLDVFRQVMMVVAIPSFTVMAFRGWDKDLRKALPAWRNALGKVAIVVIPLPLTAVFVLFLLGTTGLLRHLDATAVFVAAFWFAVAGMILALALKGLPRLEMVLAGVLTLAFLYSLACF
jgi:hypothetical protein